MNYLLNWQNSGYRRHQDLSSSPIGTIYSQSTERNCTRRYILTEFRSLKVKFPFRVQKFSELENKCLETNH